ncbi:MAG: hypothetical protein QNI99_11505 [Woeseiaceae bacterium]|nr:hypothetical protein [Woeseiaceae bacterium]
MQIGHTDGSCYCDDKRRPSPVESVNRVPPDVKRADTNAGKSDQVSLTRGDTSILSREIRQVLLSEFNFQFKASSRYGDQPAARGPVAIDIKALGRALLSASPLGARDYLGTLRQKVQDAADATRNLVGGNRPGIDSALGQINDGLDKLDAEASRNVASSASVLSYESRVKQRSVINIRTQEGDVVKLDLRRRESIEASDVAFSNGNASLTETEIDFSSRSRMFLTVKGDINEAEMAAIQTVIAQASAAADEFYSGDLAAAFDELSGMEFDADQLARVKVRFRERVETNISFASLQSFEPAPVTAPPPAADPRTEIPVVKSVPIDVIEPAAEKTEPAPAEPKVVPRVDTESDEAAPIILKPAAPAVDPIEGLADLLADFIKRSNNGFEPEGGSFRYYFSESFKLDLLKSVLEVAAPEEARGATEAAAQIVDAVNENEDAD